MKIVMLIEDTCPAGASGELHADHGIAMFVEVGSRRILFDAGPDGTFIPNAVNLGVAVSTVDFAVVSHGHYDHGGGLTAFCRENTHANIYLHSRAVEDEHLVRKSDRTMRDVGFTAGECSNRLIYVDTHPECDWEKNELWEVYPGITLFGGFPTTGFIPSGNRTLLAAAPGTEPDLVQRDDFSHEIAMLVHENNSTVLITGCSHRGIGNIVERALQLAPGKTIKAVIGGFHLTDKELKNSDTRRNITDMAERLSRYPVETYYTGHCTGKESFAVLQSVLADRVHPITTGQVIDI